MHKELLRKAIASHSADYIEIRGENRETVKIDYMGPELEGIGRNTDSGGCVRALIKGGWGFSSFNRLDNLTDHVRAATEAAKLVGKEKSSLAPVPPVTANEVTQVEKDPGKIPLEEKYALCRAYNEIILAAPKIQTSRVSYREKTVTKHFCNSEGTYLVSTHVFCGINLMAMAREGSNVQQAYHSVGDHRGYQIVEGLEEEAQKAAKRAVDLLSAPSVKGGTYTVICDPKLCGVFVHEAFGHLSEADHIYENERLIEMMRLGRRFGSEQLSIVDNPTLTGEAGFFAYDDEGVKAGHTYLIKEGILTHRLHSRETAAKMDEAPTGNARAISYRYEPIVRMSNTWLEPQEADFESMLEGVSEGIYARGALGGQTNMEMFTFSAEEAYLIQNGKLGPLVRDVILTGNVFETLANIDLIGNDLIHFGGLGGCGKSGQSPLPVATGGPHIRIQNVTIGGR
ncbi:MAG: TldD/PmbA family protein [bacterium]|nr:TldD/PmbA family protein [bacterium]